VPQIEVTFDIDANGILDVKARDKATSREQSVRITASSMLSNQDVDRMVKEAQEHAAEDRKRRESVESRNQADALAFQAERTLRDLGDKVDAADRSALQGRIDAVREKLKGDDDEAVTTAANELTETLQSVATKAYQASQEAGPTGEAAGGAAGADSAGSGGASGDDDDAVEGEFKEV
jgi:molecular chaperone DnaK